MADKIILLKDKEGNKVYPIGAGDTLANFTEKFYPVGSEYYTQDSNYDPNAKLGGIWTKIATDTPIRKFIGSQCILKGPNTYDGAQTAKLIGAYNYSLIDGVFRHITIPTGYHRAYRLTVQVHTSGSNNVRAKLNNIATDYAGTWDGNAGKTFRQISSSGFFVESDITLEPVINYSNNGINLAVQNNAAGNATIWNTTIHGYLESDKKYIVWQRTA